MITAIDWGKVERKKPLAPFSTLHAGGSAESFIIARTPDELAALAIASQKEGWDMTILGSGSNILPSDDGVSGLVVVYQAQSITVDPNGMVHADCGSLFQNLFLKTAQAGLQGLQFAVGIPGSVGGALVSNAGAYRSEVSSFLVEIEVVYNGERKWVPPSFLEFSYRDSLLRRPNPPKCAMLRLRMKLERGRAKDVFDEARDYQRQRISKQPPSASAGSFFKNVNDRNFAQSLDFLPDRFKASGVVPAGYLIEQAGLCGLRHGGAMVSRLHANFLVNVAGATATDIRSLAELVKRKVKATFGVTLEEEVLYLGDWSAFEPRLNRPLGS